MLGNFKQKVAEKKVLFVYGNIDILQNDIKYEHVVLCKKPLIISFSW